MRIRSLFLATVLAMSASAGYAQAQKAYLNPIKSKVNVGSNKKNRIATMLLMGFSKTRTIKTTRGTEMADNAQLASEGYTYAITATVIKASDSQETTDRYKADLSVEVVLTNVSTGEKIASSIFSGSSSDENADRAYFEAANNFDDEAVDFIDNSLPISAILMDIDNATSDTEVKTVKVDKGAADGVRKDMMFVVYKEVNGQRTEIGKARCEQVLGAEESLLKVYGKNDGDKEVANVFNNMDENTNIVFVSRAKNSWGQLGSQFASIFTAKKERGNFYDPDPERSAKLKIGIMSCKAGSSTVSSDALKRLRDLAVSALSTVTTIDVADNFYPTIEQARSAGLDGLVNITFDNAAQSTSQTKEGKTQYKYHVYISMEGINVHDGSWIEMRDADQPWTSTENATIPMQKAIDSMKDDIKKFTEDVFPVAGIVIAPKEVKDFKTKKSKKKGGDSVEQEPEKQRGSVKSAEISIGTRVGVRKNMMFDIYKQIVGQGEDSRVLLGTGKVTGEPEADKAIINVKGTNNGDEEMYDLFQNNDGQTEIVVISRAFINRVDSALKNIGGFLNKL